MITTRDIGRWLTKRLPMLDEFARTVYGRLPPSWHDTPTSRLAAFYADKPSVTFLQIGAFDGIAGDPLRPLILSDPRWSGLLVEPQPAAFQRLQRNYVTAGERIRFLNGAIAEENCEIDFFFVSPDEIRRRGFPSWYEELASFDRSNIEKHAPEATIEQIKIAATTVAVALAKAGFQAVDCIVLDVEGQEPRILHNINFDRLGLTFLIFEHKHLGEAELQALHKHLRDARFAIKEFGRDTIAWRVLEQVTA